MKLIALLCVALCLSACDYVLQDQYFACKGEEGYLAGTREPIVLSLHITGNNAVIGTRGMLDGHYVFCGEHDEVISFASNVVPTGPCPDDLAHHNVFDFNVVTGHLWGRDVIERLGDYDCKKAERMLNRGWWMRLNFWKHA